MGLGQPRRRLICFLGLTGVFEDMLSKERAIRILLGILKYRGVLIVDENALDSNIGVENGESGV